MTVLPPSPLHWQRSLGLLLLVLCGLPVLAQPANDNPCGATNLTVNATCVNITSTNASATATAGIPAPGCASYTGADVWFTLTVPASGGVTLIMDEVAGSFSNGGMAAYTATACNGTFTLVECDDDDGPGNMPRLDLTCLVPGSVLYVRSWRRNNTSGGQFRICAVAVAGTLATNDEPCTATALTLGSTCTTIAGSNTCMTASAGIPPPGCASYSTEDVWYTVNLPSTGTLSLQTTAGTLTDAGMALYSATACNGTFTLIECDDNDGPGSMPQIDRTCQPAGLYYVRVWGNGGADGTFNICAVFTATPPGTNDEPCTAVVLTPGPTCTTVAGTNACTSASPGIPPPGCASYSTEDVWYTVNLPSTGTLSLQTTAGTLTDAGMALYSATACNGTFTLIECDDNDGPGSMPQIDRTCQPAGLYYVRIWGNGGADGTFDICAVFTATALPANDDPCSAQVLTVGTTCSTTAGNNTCANTNTTPGDPGCGGFGAGSDDVWYSFTAPTNGIAIIETTAGTLTDASMALYSGACGSLTLVECDADDGPGGMPAIAHIGLTPGATYFVRVWGTGTTQGTFNICVRSPSTPAGFSCAWMLEMFDSAGDGWGTSSVNISINGAPATSYTVTGAFNIILIGVNNGQTVTVSYTASGPNQGQNSYRIRRFPWSEPYFNSGSPPTAGTAYTQTVNCLAPVQSQEDCLGALTLCGGADVSAYPNSTGNVADLSGLNYGCLASAERQGLWYIYRMSAGGNVGMTIDPDGNDDYDWAIWGPYPSASTTSSVCVPAGAPVRCSYASGAATVGATGSYNTGMGHPTYGASPQFANPTPAVSEGSGGDGWVRGMLTNTGDVFLLYISNYSVSGLSFLLTWQLSNGASLDCAVLPVDYLSLNASVAGPANLVEWSTATEQYSAFFEVQRADGSMAFETIGTLEASGGSQQRIDYSFRDEDPLEGANYYRLKQVDTDGAYELSPVVVAFRAKPAEAPLVFPNPARDILYVPITVEADATTYLQVLDAAGRVVRDRDMDLQQGAHTVQIPLEGLPAGAYELRLQSTSSAVPVSTRFLKE